jgi:AraC family transcriptional regulator of adaptative response/methylated-DNA-[protein]-cysteine methyltransferase
MNQSQLSKDYYRIEKVIHFLEENFQSQPSLQEIAKVSGVSEYHFQRIFQRWAGISPKKFLQFLTKEYAKDLLKKTSVLEVSYDAGLSGPSRLHDLFVNCEAVSPGEYKQKGKGLTIGYGFHPSCFGDCFIAVTDRGICRLSFVHPGNTREDILRSFKKEWENAQLQYDSSKTKEYAQRIFSFPRTKKISLLCKGSNFQMKVWEALLKIKPGTVMTYQTIARQIGCPLACRAVGNAVGQNPIAYLIPCHRVIRGSGHWGGYRWGLARKKAILAKEFLLRNN